MAGFHAQILQDPLQWEDGYLIPPKRPGLGVELNEDVVSRHLYTGKETSIDVFDNQPYVEKAVRRIVGG
jgi:2-dehydro-3-deoxyphosphogalactonate aldolase